MTGQDLPSHELSEHDCATCINMIQQRTPLWAAKLERLKRAGFELPEPIQRNALNRQAAEGILREYFPDRTYLHPQS